MTAPAIQDLFSFFSVDELAVVVDAGECVVGEAPGVAEVCDSDAVDSSGQQVCISCVGLRVLTGSCGLRSGLSENLRCRIRPSHIAENIYVRSIRSCIVVYCHKGACLTRCTAEV
jgi:hypothetical protein